MPLLDIDRKETVTGVKHSWPCEKGEGGLPKWFAYWIMTPLFHYYASIAQYTYYGGERAIQQTFLPIQFEFVMALSGGLPAPVLWEPLCYLPVNIFFLSTSTPC